MEGPARGKYIVAMSGGVDSSVAAFLMKEAGFACIGATMKLFRNEDAGLPKGHPCCSADDVSDARSVAFSLDLPYYVFNFQERFREDVIERFIASYENGETPNPCLDCNRYLKFDQLLRRAEEIGFDGVATGHYARIEQDPVSGRYLLKKAKDLSKDQSYVLYTLSQDQLARTRFPLGGMTKSEVRAIAEEQGFLNAKKHDSQDICFVPDRNYIRFIEQYTGKTYPPGDYVSTDGKILGKHRGIIRYTIGQRKGLGLPLDEPLYVCEIRPEENTVVLGSSEELFSSELTAKQINLISVPEISAPMRVRAKIRYRQPEQPATVIQTAADTLRITFDDPQRAVTKGQAVVLYDGETVVGGGTIQ